MSRRRTEFSPKVKLAIYLRAGGPDNVRCEKCAWKIRGRNFEIDHKVSDWISSGKPLTAEDGWLLGNDRECGCHRAKTSREAGERAHGVRIQMKAANATPKRTSKPMAGTRASGWKQKLSGEWVRR